MTGTLNLSLQTEVSVILYEIKGILAQTTTLIPFLYKHSMSKRILNVDCCCTNNK